MGKWHPELPTDEKPKRKYTGSGTKPGLSPFRKPMHPIARKGARIQKGTHMPKMKPMNDKEIEKEVARMMKLVRESPAYSTDQTQAVTREFLEQLKSEIDTEMDGLQG